MSILYTCFIDILCTFIIRKIVLDQGAEKAMTHYCCLFFIIAFIVRSSGGWCKNVLQKYILVKIRLAVVPI